MASGWIILTAALVAGFFILRAIAPRFRRGHVAPFQWKQGGRQALWETRALVRRALSYRTGPTGTWSLSDYPVRFRKQDVSDLNPWSDWGITLPWVAQIINWYAVSGGATKAEAYADLSARFEEYREAHESLPRPGKHVPVEFAPRRRIDANSELAEDLIVRVLGFESPDMVWLSDESSLWDFAGPATKQEYVRKIKRLYGVDVSDVEKANTGSILERISEESRGDSGTPAV